MKATFSVNKLLKRSTLGNVFSMRVIFSFFYTVSNTRNMSVNISVDSLETLEETFFLGGERQYFFLRLLCARKKTDRKMHFINYNNSHKGPLRGPNARPLRGRIVTFLAHVHCPGALHLALPLF